MEYKKLGRTDLSVSRIGFGCWAIGGHGYGRVDEAEAIRSLRAAFDAGINFFDTADVYGFGRSEEIIAKALGHNIHDVVLATKFGVRWDASGRTWKDISPNHVRLAIENSLRRLNLDCIPLYQIHWPDDTTPIADVMEVLSRCRDAGKIRHIGCCNFSKDMLQEIDCAHRMESVQYLFNVARRENEPTMRYASEELSSAVLVYSVIGRGMFSGKYSAHSTFSEGDTRSSDPDFSGALFEKNAVFANKLKEVGVKYGKSSAQIAIRWAVENQLVTTAITGIKNCNQLWENTASLGWDMDESDLTSLDTIETDCEEL